MTDSFAAWVSPEQAIADHDADIREPLLARIAVLEGQVARVEEVRNWCERLVIFSAASKIDQALAIPAEPAGVSRESIDQEGDEWLTLCNMPGCTQEFDHDHDGLHVRQSSLRIFQEGR